MTEIDERQQKRAANIVWNCAGRYDFRPDFRAYDVRGRADLYWNCIFGAARKHYDYAVFAQIFAGLQQYEDADTYTDLFWLGLENCVYQRELPQRPALEALRRRYAEQFVRQHQGAEDFQFYDSLALAHFSRVLGLESRMNKYDSKLLDELEFTPDMTETEIAALWYLAGKLEPDRRYSEAELNDLLDAWSTFHDPATLRRELYNKKLVERTDNGAEYWRCESIPALDEFTAKYI